MLGIVSGAALFSCTPSKKTERGPEPNVLLITIDTLRADHLGAYGHAIETPNIDALAKGGILFKKTYAHAPLTLPSHTSIHTGTYPNFHGVRNNGEFRASEELNTAAEIFKGAGYDTAAFVGSFVLDSRFGLDQGFDTYNDDMIDGRQKSFLFAYKDVRAELVVSRTVDWLEKQVASSASPFFVWMHLFDPHAKYEAPEPFASRYPDVPYDAEIAYTDAQLGKLILKLKELGLYGNTLIVLTSDHGESLGEHGEDTHSIFIYNSTIHVPLIMKVPENKFAGKAVEQLVRHIDILPTMLDITGVGKKSPEKMLEDVQGISLLEIMKEGGESGGDDLRLLSYAESYLPKYYYRWAPPESIRSDEYEYINLPTREFYNLNDDPTELNNLYESRTELAGKYALRLEEMKEISAKGRIANARREMDKETLAKLKSLGYLHGDETFSQKEEEDLNGKDPKGAIYYHTELIKIQTYVNEKQYREAVDGAVRLLKEDPGNALLAFSAAEASLMMGKYGEAARFYRLTKETYSEYLAAYLGLLDIYTFLDVDYKAAEKELKAAFALAPSTPTLWVAKGNLEKERGDLDSAMQSYNRAKDMGGHSPGQHVGLAGVYAMKGKMERAEEEYLEALRIMDEEPAAHYGLGIVYENTDRIEMAEKEYRQAIQYGRPDPKYYSNLGSVLARRKRFGEAASYLEKSLELDPNNTDAIYNLGTVRKDTGKLDEAEALLTKTIRLKPDMIHAYVSLAATYLKMNDREKAFATFRKITTIAPDIPLPWYQMAIIAVSQNRLDEAKQYLKAAIEKGGPQVIEAASGEAALKELVPQLR